jgi:hypothetical protein
MTVRRIEMKLARMIMRTALMLVAAVVAAASARAQMVYGISAVVNLTDTTIST